MDKYVIVVNGGLYVKDDRSNVFNGLDEVKKEIVEWSRGERLEDEDGEEILFEDLLNDVKEVWCVYMCEMGDEFVSVSVEKLE